MDTENGRKGVVAMRLRHRYECVACGEEFSSLLLFAECPACGRAGEPVEARDRVAVGAVE
jgi:rRNA maturation endonuclease Nob1